MGWVNIETIVPLGYHHSVTVWHSQDFWHCRIAQGNSNVCDWRAVTSLCISCHSWLFCLFHSEASVTMETAVAFMYIREPQPCHENQGSVNGVPCISWSTAPCKDTLQGIWALLEWDTTLQRGSRSGQMTPRGRKLGIPSAIAEWPGVSSFLKAGGADKR